MSKNYLYILEAYKMVYIITKFRGSSFSKLEVKLGEGSCVSLFLSHK